MADADGTTSVSENEVECPWCGERNDWTDVRTDDCLRPGYETECAECGKPIRIEAVDWEPTIYTVRGGKSTK